MDPIASQDARDRDGCRSGGNVAYVRMMKKLPSTESAEQPAMARNHGSGIWRMRDALCQVASLAYIGLSRQRGCKSTIHVQGVSEVAILCLINIYMAQLYRIYLHLVVYIYELTQACKSAKANIILG